MNEELKSYLDRSFTELHTRLDAHSQKFDAINRRFDGIDQRLDDIEAEFPKVYAKIDDVKKELKTFVLESFEAQQEFFKNEIQAEYGERVDHIEIHLFGQSRAKRKVVAPTA